MDPVVNHRFKGLVGVADVREKGIARNADGRAETLHFDADMRFVKGVCTGQIPGSASASRMRIPDRVFQDPGIGKVAGVHNMTFPDPEESDELASADPAQVVRPLRPCVLSLAAHPDHSEPSQPRPAG